MPRLLVLVLFYNLHEVDLLFVGFFSCGYLLQNGLDGFAELVEPVYSGICAQVLVVGY